MGEWYKRMFEDAFGKYWERIFSFKERKETDQEVSFLKELLSAGLILDDACGLGRISIPLSRHVPVVGLDLSSYLLRKATKGLRIVASKTSIRCVVICVIYLSKAMFFILLLAYGQVLAIFLKEKMRLL